MKGDLYLMTLETFLNNSPDLKILIKDESGKIIYPTSKTSLLFFSQLISTNITEYYHPITKKYFKKTKSYAKEDKHTYQIIRYTDITFLKKVQKSYEIDASTKIPLKKKALSDFTRYLDEALSMSEEFAVAMADIDFFKQVNDSFGHQAGDYVLYTIAQILSSNICHEEDERIQDIIGRFGGEEFLMVLKNSSATTSLQRLDFLRGSIQNKVFSFQEKNIHVTCSFGVVHISSSYLKNAIKNKIAVSTLQKLLIERTDQQLYRAKDSGRNQVCIHILKK